MTFRPVFAVAGALALVAALSGAAHAADKFLGRFGKWEAHRIAVGAETLCYAASLPTKSEGKIAKRGEATLMIAHWPKRKTFGQIQAKAGFALKKDGTVDLAIGSKIFKLNAAGDSAYSDGAKADGEIQAALKAGATATATALAAAGNAKIVDTYSLDGLTKALAAIDKECGKK